MRMPLFRSLAALSWLLAERAGASRRALLGFEEWMELHGKAYETPGEIEARREIFLANAGVVQRHNAAHEAGLTSYAMSLESPFADLTDEEFEAAYLMESQNCSATHLSSGELPIEAAMEDLPSFVDWRTRGIVTPIKNQKMCGSCWTFSTTGTLEAHTCLNNLQPEGVDCTKWTGLAEQQLLDCASAYDNHGCNGGLPSHAFEYLKDAGGMDTEESYHYRAKDDGPCAATEGTVGAVVAEVFNITAYDEDGLVSAIARIGPVSIAYQVAADFRLYSHGVYDSWNATTQTRTCQSGPQDVNHAVVAVGYGETEATDKKPSVPYYIVRNSWSTSWGMEGYFWMERNQNLCGVSDCASFPIVPAAVRAEPEEEKPGSLRSSAAALA